MISLYVIKSKSKQYRYVGITKNLRRRLKEHEYAKKSYGPLITILVEQFSDYKKAREREKFLKSGVGRKYLDVIEQ